MKPGSPAPESGLTTPTPQRKAQEGPGKVRDRDSGRRCTLYCTPVLYYLNLEHRHRSRFFENGILNKSQFLRNNRTWRVWGCKRWRGTPSQRPRERSKATAGRLPVWIQSPLPFHLAANSSPGFRLGLASFPLLPQTPPPCPRGWTRDSGWAIVIGPGAGTGSKPSQSESCPGPCLAEEPFPSGCGAQRARSPHSVTKRFEVDA